MLSIAITVEDMVLFPWVNVNLLGQDDGQFIHIQSVSLDMSSLDCLFYYYLTLFIYLAIYLFVCLFVCLSICPSIYLRIYWVIFLWVD